MLNPVESAAPARPPAIIKSKMITSFGGNLGFWVLKDAKVTTISNHKLKAWTCFGIFFPNCGMVGIWLNFGVATITTIVSLLSQGCDWPPIQCWADHATILQPTPDPIFSASPLMMRTSLVLNIFLFDENFVTLKFSWKKLLKQSWFPPFNILAFWLLSQHSDIYIYLHLYGCEFISFFLFPDFFSREEYNTRQKTWKKVLQHFDRFYISSCKKKAMSLLGLIFWLWLIALKSISFSLICVNLEWREVYVCKKSRKVWIDLVDIPAGQ